jgi:hypothetical protein
MFKKQFAKLALGAALMSSRHLRRKLEARARLRRRAQRPERPKVPSRRATPFRGSPSIRSTLDCRCSRCGGIQTRAPRRSCKSFLRAWTRAGTGTPRRIRAS